MPGEPPSAAGEAVPLPAPAEIHGDAASADLVGAASSPSGGDLWAAPQGAVPLPSPAEPGTRSVKEGFEPAGRGAAANAPVPLPQPEVAAAASAAFIEVPPATASPAAPPPLPVHAPEQPFEPIQDPFAQIAAGAAPERAAHDPAAVAAAPADDEELEMLFDEGGAAEYRVRRSSGRVFGPFAEVAIAEMLRKGELLGNEEVSPDGGATWSPIGSVASFADVMRKLVEAPAARAAPVVQPSPSGYRSRMAEARVVSGPALPIPASLTRFGALLARHRVALGIAAAAVLLLVAVVAVVRSPALQRLVGGRGRAEATARLLAQARSAIAEDRLVSARSALDNAEQAMRVDPDDATAQAVYAQAAFWLARHGAAPQAVVSRAGTLASALASRRSQPPDALKALVARELVRESAGAAPGPLQALERHARREPGDAEAAFLLGEGARSRGDLAQAASWYERLEAAKPGAARASHASGVLALARRDVEKARAAFEEAIRRDPRHAASAIELARIAERSGDPGRAVTLLRQALAAADELGNADRVQARVLLATILARQGGDGAAAGGEADKAFEEALRDDPSNSTARVAFARLLARRAAHDRVAAVLAPALSSGANDPEAVALAARALAGTGRVLDAVTLVDSGLAKSPGEPRLLYVKGLVLEQSGKRVEAVRLYEDAAARAPGDPSPRIALGRAALRAGDLDRAGRELGAAAEKAPSDPDAQTGLGDLALARKDTAAAEIAYRRALALDPGGAPAHFGLARVLLARGDDAGARGELERALQLDPRLPEARLVLGDLLRKAGDLVGAERAFEAAVEADAADALARTRLGTVRLDAGKVAEAAADLQAACALDGSLSEARYRYGLALLARGDAAAAVEQLRRAVDLDRASGAYPLALGTAYERGGAAAEALEAYRLAASREPKLAEAHERIALLFAAHGRCDEALAPLRRAISAAPSLTRLAIELADCEVKLGHPAAGLEIYRRVLKAHPGEVTIPYRIARAVHDASGIDAALPWYERAAREERQNPMPHYYLAYAHKERGRRSQAVQEFRRYLALRPDADDKQDIEQEIEDLGGGR